MPLIGETGKRWFSVAVSNPAEATARLSIKVESFLDPLFHRPNDVSREYLELLETQPFSLTAAAQHETYKDEFREVWGSLDLAAIHRGHSHDADRSLALAVYVAIRESEAELVVETGVARGVTSRVVLEAFRRNPRPGRLVSVDLPPLSGSWEEAGRTAVPDSLRGSWTYVRGTSRQALPRVARRYPFWDVFIHDSGHTFRNMKMEFELAKSVLRPGGWLISDDIEENRAFLKYVDRDPEFSTNFIQGAQKNNIVGIARQRNPGWGRASPTI
jgi:predicted O-methyltransferase YrrM